jgi:hypothetical protein
MAKSWGMSFAEMSAGTKCSIRFAAACVADASATQVQMSVKRCLCFIKFYKKSGCVRRAGDYVIRRDPAPLRRGHRFADDKVESPGQSPPPGQSPGGAGSRHSTMSKQCDMENSNLIVTSCFFLLLKFPEIKKWSKFLICLYFGMVKNSSGQITQKKQKIL